MEGSEGEKVFDSHGLNPRLFVNEALNCVDDVVDGAFDFFLQRARELVGVGDGDAGEGHRSEELVKGISLLREKIQSVLDRRLSFWENYCLHHCFSVPEGFSSMMKFCSITASALCSLQSLTEDASCDISNILDSGGDKDLDDQLQSLRSKIDLAGKERTRLQEEILAVEKQFVLINHYNSAVEEAVQLFENNSMHDFIQEIAKLAPPLLAKLDELMLKEKHNNFTTSNNICSDYTPLNDDGIGLCSNLQDLQQIVHRLNSK